VALFGRRAPDPDHNPAPPQRPLRVLRADGQRIDLTARDTSTRLAATKQAWQATALAYRNLIGEIRYAQKLRAQAVARCRFYVAENRPWPADPAPLDGTDHELDPQLAADALVNFRVIPFDPAPDGFTARLDENLAAVGEAWIHIDPDQVWAVRSISEVNIAMDGRVGIAGLPGGQANRPVDPENESLLRCWVPDLEWSELADAPMRPLLDVAEEVVLAGREMRAAARSRVAANGILLLPSSMSLVRDRGEDEDNWDDTVASDTFMADLTAALLAPLADDGDAGQVVPLVLRGDIDDINAVKHLVLQRADAERLIERQQAALLRLLHSLDVQPEQVEGIGQANHWSGWQVDARAIKEQVQPAADTVAACLMKGWMRPALQSLGYTDEQIARVTIVADASNLAENPNRGQDARDAWDRGTLSDDALNRELGFDEEDKPDEQEWMRRLAFQGKLPVAEVAQLMGLRKEDPGVVVDAGLGAPALPGGERRVAQPGQIIPEQPAPTMPAGAPDPSRGAPAPLRAAGPPDAFAMHVDDDACRSLAGIDAALSQRVSVAADAALNRVLERAGARVRSAAQRDRGLAAQLVNIDPVAIPAALGRSRVGELVQVADLVTDEYARLRGQVTGWLRDAGVQAGLTACDVVGVNANGPAGQRLSADVASRLAQHVDPAWQLLLSELHEAAEWALFAPAELDDDEPGERSGSPLSAQDIADVLAVAGGDRPSLIAAADEDALAFARDDKGQRRKHRRPEKKRRARDTPGTGVATGPVMQSALAAEGAVLMGWEWDYRDFVPRKMFEPHHRLDGTRVSTWSDPKLDTDPRNSWLGPSFAPGDHKGCLCGSIPIYAALDDPEGIVARRLAAAKGDPRRVAVDQLAAADDAAGRTGTSAQQTAEIRRRLTDAIDAMRAEHIEKPRKRRGRR
jgi:hypothetical protein